MRSGHRTPAPPTSSSPESGRRYGGVTPADRVAARRARIIEAGVALFGSRGYQATTMAMLSVESGVPHRYFVQIFPTREALLREIYVGIHRDVTEALDRSRASDTADPMARIRLGVTAAAGAFLHDPRKTRINCIEVVGVSPAFESLRREAIRAFSRLILEQVETLVSIGLIPPRDYHFGAIGLVGAFNELMTEWVLTQEDERLAASVLVEHIEAFFWGALLAARLPLRATP